MFCEKCGTKNEPSAKFCEKCGHKFEIEEPTKLNNIINNFQKLPKKQKIIMCSVTIVIILALIILTILLNNPVKRVNDSLENYYNKYQDNSTKELIDINEILSENKNNPEILTDIEKTVSDEIDNWVKNFNTKYSNKETLNDSFKKISNALTTIYNYFNGNDYILNKETYEDLTSKIKDLYSSKINYLYGKEEKDEYSKYAYFLRVIEEDSYYKETQEYVETYVKTELENFKKEVESKLDFTTETPKTTKLDKYLEVIDYIKKNHITNNIDLSSSKEYQSLLENYQKEAMNLAKELANEKKEDLDYPEALKILNKVLAIFDEEDSNYQTLQDLISEYEEILPDELVNKYVVDYLHSNDSKYSTTINDEKYDNYLYFSFDGENATRTYRLNKAYKTLKTKIVIGPDWPKDYSGKIVIYGDDTEIYHSDLITKETKENLDIKLDITNVDDLKIVFETKNQSKWTERFYIYLVEPYLYK